MACTYACANSINVICEIFIERKLWRAGEKDQVCAGVRSVRNAENYTRAETALGMNNRKIRGTALTILHRFYFTNTAWTIADSPSGCYCIEIVRLYNSLNFLEWISLQKSEISLQKSENTVTRPLEWQYFHSLEWNFTPKNWERTHCDARKERKRASPWSISEALFLFCRLSLLFFKHSNSYPVQGNSLHPFSCVRQLRWSDWSVKRRLFARTFFHLYYRRERARDCTQLYDCNKIRICINANDLSPRIWYLFI